MPGAGKTAEYSAALPEEHRHWLRNVILITVSQFFAQLAFSSAMTFIPFYFKELGVTEKDALSMYVAVFAMAGNLSFCLCSPMWGALADRFGRKLMLLRSTLGGALLMPLMAFITVPGLLVFHRFLLGGLVGTVTAAQTLIIATTPQKRLTFSLGAVSAGLFAGIMAGQFLGGIAVSRFGFFATFIWSGILLGVSTVLVFFTKEHFRRLPAPSPGGRSPFRLPRFGTAGLLLLLFAAMGFSRDIDGPFLPQLVMEVVNKSEQALLWTGWINGLCALGGMLSGLILGYAAGKLPLLKVLTVVIFIAGTARLLLAFAPSAQVIMGERFVQVLAAGGMEPLFQAWVAGAVLARDQGMILGWSATARSAGWMTGSLAGGGLAVAFGGVHGLFFVSGLLYLLLIPTMFLIARRVPPPPPGAVKKHRKARA